MDHGASLIADIQLYDKYARWLEHEQRRETWTEVVARVMLFLKTSLDNSHRRIDHDEWAALEEAMQRKDVLPSMRVVQMAGAPLERCHVGGYNCAYLELDGPQALGELLYILMQGTGVGYSVEQRVTQQWPSVSTPSLGPTTLTLIEDSTEGWCRALVRHISLSLAGWDPQWDYSAIRAEGTWLHTKGGRASGPEPLRKLLATAHTLIRDASGRKLRPFEIHRLATMCGAVVQVGGVRRAAEIALFDPDDTEMATCKDGNFWETFPELAMANNSMVFTGDANPEQIHALVTHLSTVGSGEPGIFRRDGITPARRRIDLAGVNPCGEIILRSRQFCNLSMAVARYDDTEETLTEKVCLATILGTIQSCLTTFRYLDPRWEENSAAERLLGVDITGTMDCPLLHPGPELGELLERLQTVALTTNVVAAGWLRVERSASVTCNKPSGNSSQLLGASSGIHPRYAAYYLRRLRIGARSPLAERLRECGIPCYPEVGQGTLEDATVWVFELPVQSPEASITRHQMTARAQLDYWLTWKQRWTEHNPSCTVYVGETEWPDVEQFLLAHWHDVGGLSFLPKDQHTYALAPYEELTEAEYRARLDKLPDSLHLETVQELIDLTTVSQDYACVGGSCEV